MSADLESMSYLMLANQMLHQFYPHVITIAEVGQIVEKILCCFKRHFCYLLKNVACSM